MELVEVLAIATVSGGLTQPLPACGPVTAPAKTFRIHEGLYRHQWVAKMSFPVRTHSMGRHGEHTGSQIRRLATLMEKHEASILPHEAQPPPPLHIRPPNSRFSFPQMIGGLPETQ